MHPARYEFQGGVTAVNSSWPRTEPGSRREVDVACCGGHVWSCGGKASFEEKPLCSSHAGSRVISAHFFHLIVLVTPIYSCCPHHAAVKSLAPPRSVAIGPHLVCGWAKPFPDLSPSALMCFAVMAAFPPELGA